MKRKTIGKFLSAALAGTMICSLTACGSAASADVAVNQNDDTEASVTTIETTGATGATIEMEYSVTGDQLTAFQQLVQKFTDETGIGVSITQPGNGYEDAMKTRMASGDLPDVWVTHGWSVARYSEYLTPLEGEDWFGKIDESLLPSITDEEGHVYVLPITEAVCGVIYNKDVMDKAGVDVTKIRTWDDFTKACQAVKDNTDATPIEMSCNASGVNSYLLECMLPTYLSNEDAPGQQAEALIDGSFDFTKDGGEAFTQIAEWSDAGFFNEDSMTADLTTAEKALSNAEAGFLVYSTECIPAMLTYTPDTNLGVIPSPAVSAEGKSYYGVGEGNFSCFGIWKDTEHMDECKQFLEFLARPENADKIAVDVDGGIPCLSDTEITDAYVLNIFKESQEQFKDDLIYDNFFDRKYQPSGMWGVFDDSMDILLDGNASENVSAALESMQTNYSDLHE
ncbi:carbohydrate ABC transporter substrate-binding protein, CUT1 family [Lachnospiraceae bacterium KH1T2]|nr:carbohydrate ABC transporter substrate-binding protein, CUT1 family [Lachnospiraceae bacterium KH1T2]